MILVLGDVLLDKFLLDKYQKLNSNYVKVIEDFNYSSGNNKDFLQTRLKNNVILKIKVNKEESSLTMISEGNLDSKKEEKEKRL